MLTSCVWKFAERCRQGFGVRVLVIIALSTCAAIPVAASGDPIVVDANATPCTKPAATHFTMIQAAVDAASAGTTILVCPGTYAEQVTISTALTLKGVPVPNANNGAGAGAATIAVPAGLTTNAAYAGTTTPVAAQVLIHAPNVTLDNLGVDGTNALSDCTSPMLVGIDFDSGSSGSAQRLAVKNQNVANPSGGFCNLGIGILANSGSLKVAVQNSVIHNFDLAGIDAEALVDVDNIVLGAVAGQTQAVGVFLNSPSGAGSSVDSSTITGANIGIECESCPQASFSANNVSGNPLIGMVIGDSNSNVTISGNTLSFPTFGGIFAAGSGDVVKNNYIAGTMFGIVTGPSNGEKIDGNTINDAQFGIVGASGNKVSGNTFLNVATLTQ
jgi:Periplasmic copper-binding protein (NosD)